MQDGQRGVPQDAPQALLQLAGRPVPTELDHQTAGRGVALGGLQLTGDESDGDDTVLLGGVEQPRAGALPSRVVLEAHLREPGERVTHVGLVVDRQPPPSPRVDVGEGAVTKAGALARVETGHLRAAPSGPSPRSAHRGFRAPRPRVPRRAR